MTFLSRVLGLVRDMVIAALFGATASMDAFLVAFKIPNFMRRLFAEGAFSQAFVPILADYRQTQSKQETAQFVNAVFGNLALVCLLVCAVGVLASPWVINLFAPGFEPGSARIELSTTMLRITFPYLFLIALTSLYAGILHTSNRFAAAAFAPILLNVALIASALLLSDYFPHPIVALAVGVLIGGVAQFLFMMSFVGQTGIFPLPKINWRHPGVMRVLKLMVPAIFGVSIHQINMLVDTVFASFLKPGSVSYLYFADRLMEFPLGIVGVGLATVMLPNLARSFANKDEEKYNSTLLWGVQTTLLIGLPAAAGLYCLAGPLVSTLFQTGHFSGYDVAQTAECLMAYAPGIVGLMMVKVLASAFYARQDIKTPVKVAALAVVVNIVFNALFIIPFAQTGIALATSISALTNGGVLWFIHKRRGHLPVDFKVKRVVWQSALGVGVMMIAVLWLAPALQNWIGWSRVDRILPLLGLVAGGAVLYASVLFLTGFKLKTILK